MRAGIAIGFTVIVAACGQPEDVLHIDGRTVDGFGAPIAGVPVTLYRDNGATDFGCSTFSPWQQLTSGDGGLLHVEHLREETTGRYGFNRCLRLEWSCGGTDAGTDAGTCDVGLLDHTSSLSWLGRTRDTLLPDLITSFEITMDAPPSLPFDNGSVAPPEPGFEARDGRGVFFREVFPDAQSLTDAFSSLENLEAAAGLAPANNSDAVLRVVQHGQQEQQDAFEQMPLLEFEFRIETVLTGAVSATGSYEELGHGSACNVQEPGGTACAFTDGLFDPVDVPSTTGVDGVAITLSAPTVIHTVVVRGIWGIDPFSTIILEQQLPGDTTWTQVTQLSVQPQPELLQTASFEDPLPLLFEVISWAGTPTPVSGVRLRLQDDMGQPVAISWLGEVSLY
jgi:hypothetical protein